MGFFPKIFVYLDHKVFNVQTLTFPCCHHLTPHFMLCLPTETLSVPGQALKRAQWHPGVLCATVGSGFHVRLARIMFESHNCTKFSPSQM